MSSTLLDSKLQPKIMKASNTSNTSKTSKTSKTSPSSTRTPMPTYRRSTNNTKTAVNSVSISSPENDSAFKSSKIAKFVKDLLLIMKDKEFNEGWMDELKWMENRMDTWSDGNISSLHKRTSEFIEDELEELDELIEFLFVLLLWENDINILSKTKKITHLRVNKYLDLVSAIIYKIETIAETEKEKRSYIEKELNQVIEETLPRFVFEFGKQSQKTIHKKYIHHDYELFKPVYKKAVVNLKNGKNVNDGLIKFSDSLAYRKKNIQHYYENIWVQYSGVLSVLIDARRNILNMNNSPTEPTLQDILAAIKNKGQKTQKTQKTTKTTKTRKGGKKHNSKTQKNH